MGIFPKMHELLKTFATQRSKAIDRLVLAEESLDKIGKILKKKGVSLNQLISGGREVRKEIFREKYAQETTS